MSGRVTPSLGPIRGAGVASVYLRPGSLFSTGLECRSEMVELIDRKYKRANLASQTEKSKHRRRLGETKKTGLVVAHSSSRPAQGVGGCLLPTPWPFGDTQHNPFHEIFGEGPFGS